jgi:hypothetical protein
MSSGITGAIAGFGAMAAGGERVRRLSVASLLVGWRPTKRAGEESPRAARYSCTAWRAFSVTRTECSNFVLEMDPGCQHHCAHDSRPRLPTSPLYTQPEGPGAYSRAVEPEGRGVRSGGIHSMPGPGRSDDLSRDCHRRARVCRASCSSRSPAMSRRRSGRAGSSNGSSDFYLGTRA